MVLGKNSSPSEGLRYEMLCIRKLVESESGFDRYVAIVSKISAGIQKGNAHCLALTIPFMFIKISVLK